MKTDKLTRRNFLKGIGLAGILGIGLAGCKNSEYYFDGVIDGEKVKFYEKGPLQSREVLEIIKKDGTEILYSNMYLNSINPSKIIITKNNREKIEYNNNKTDEVGRTVLIEGKKQYKNYLEKILKEKERIKQEKIQEGLDLIKNKN